MNQEAIQPAILTCPDNPERSYEFFRSYETVVKPLWIHRPVVMVGGESSIAIPGEYFNILNQCLHPKEIHLHARSQPSLPIYYSVEDALQRLLWAAVRLCTGTHILFLEDDIVFLPNFVAELDKVDPNPQRGFTTFWYSEAHKLSPDQDSNELNPEKFWGSQCLLIPVQQAYTLAKHHDAIKRPFPECWDIYWSRFLASQGFKLYCTDESCVRELEGPSRIQRKFP